jgi:hypothetical protein
MRRQTIWRQRFARRLPRGNHALLHVADMVVARRKALGEPLKALAPATSALADAERQVELPKDVQHLDALFTQLEATAADLDDTIAELATGAESREVRQRARRIDELMAEGAPAPGQQYAAEREAERTARAQRATQRASAVVAEAISADEADALKISINHHTPTPNAA